MLALAHFDWAGNKERFAILNEPGPSYHGVVYTEALGEAAFIGRARGVPLRNTGGALAAQSAFQLMPGLETLALRMERQCENAEKACGKGRCFSAEPPSGQLGQLCRSGR